MLDDLAVYRAGIDKLNMVYDDLTLLPPSRVKNGLSPQAHWDVTYQQSYRNSIDLMLVTSHV
jgi:hypothetical protein